MKKRSYKLSLPRWALAQRESWYAELAARGLRVQKAGAMLTRFAPAPPARLRYRFEIGSDEGGLPAGQKEFYEECGWQYVLNDRPLHLFCAPEQTDAPDLHTDPAALADSLKTLRGSILSQALGTALWALLMFAQLTYLGRYTLELVLADAAAPLVWAILAVTLFRLGWGVYSMLALMRTRRMLRAGAMPRHGPGWRRAALTHRAACALLGAVYAVCLAVSLLELARYEKTPLPETGAGLPLLTLAEVEGAGYRRAAEAAPNVRDDVNQLVQTWTPGAPLGLSAWEAGYADGTQDTVYLVQRYCRLSGAGGAKAFGRGLARRLWLLEPEEYTVLKETPDTLVLANYEDGPGFHQTLLLVVDGPDVLFLHYWGGGARSADVGAAAQARFAEYTAAARGR